MVLDEGRRFRTDFGVVPILQRHVQAPGRKVLYLLEVALHLTLRRSLDIHFRAAGNAMTWKDLHLDAVLAIAERLSNDCGQSFVPRQVQVELGTMLGNLRDFLGSLELRFEEQRLIHTVTEQANAGIILDEILERIFDSFRLLVPYDRIGLALLERNGTYLRARWGAPMPTMSDSRSALPHPWRAQASRRSSSRGVLES